MINHRACEQLIPFYNNLKKITLEQAKTMIAQCVHKFNVVSNIANSFWKGAMDSELKEKVVRLYT